MSTYAPMIPFFLLVVVCLGVVLFVANRVRLPSRRLAAGRMTLIWIMACWLAGVLMITVIASLGMENYFHPGSQVDLIPFRTLVEDGPGLGGIAVGERLANIAMFLVGGLVTAVAMGWGVGRTAVVFLVFGAVIEAVQFVVPGSRAVTTDDVLWAVIGGALGAVLALPVRSMGWHRALFPRRVAIMG